MKLSKRLQAAADFVDSKDKTLDIGCDHGYLDIYLALNKKNKLIIASDISNEVIKTTNSNLKKYNVEKQIKTYCTDGVLNITENYNTIIVTGLGSHTILNILKQAKRVNKLIISSNNNWDLVRKDVINLGYNLVEEKLIYEKGKIYSVMLFVKGYKKLSKKEIRVGKYSFKNKEMYKLLYDNYESIYKKIPIKEIKKKIYYYKTLYDLKSYLRKKDREII